MESQKKRIQEIPNFVEGVDYYYNERGMMVLTEAYLSKRGYCCKNGCLHCPYPKNLKNREEKKG